MLDVDRCAGVIIKWRWWMGKILRREMDCILMRGRAGTARRVIFRGGAQARRKGRWSNANIVAKLKRRVLGPFMRAEDVWRASRQGKRGFRLGMGLAELRARMRGDHHGSRGAGWYVHRFRRARPVGYGELVWLGGHGDRDGEFLGCDEGRRFYAPGGPRQPPPVRAGPAAARFGVGPARWKAMHAVRGFPSAARRMQSLPDIPKKDGWARLAFARTVCPPEEDWVDLTQDDDDTAGTRSEPVVVVEEAGDPDAAGLSALEEGIWTSVEPFCAQMTYIEALTKDLN
jgi:hypothetical protein